MRVRAAVSFESDLVPPDTFRGEFVVVKAKTAAYRALQAASRKYPRRRWRSVVIVLEHLDPQPDEVQP